MPHADAMMARQLAFLTCCGASGGPVFHTLYRESTLTCVLHDATNSVPYFQSSMDNIFAHLGVLIWLDEILRYLQSYSDLLKILRQAFLIRAANGLKLNQKKCQLVAKVVHLCGLIIDQTGVKFNPSNYNVLNGLPTPTTVGSLMESVHGTNWMRTAMQSLAEIVAPLQSLLERHYRINKSGKKTRLYNRPFSGSGDDEDSSFKALVCEIIERQKLLTHDPTKRLFFFTDASSTHRAGVRTQMAEFDILHSMAAPQEWEHEPTTFVSGSFKGSSLRWSPPEKECYDVIASVIRLFA